MPYETTPKIPKLATPREAAACAMGALLAGASVDEAIVILNENGVQLEIKANGTMASVRLRLSPRKSGEASAGNRHDAMLFALADALGGKEEG